MPEGRKAVRVKTLVLGAGPVGLVAARMLGGVAVGSAVGVSQFHRYAPTYLWATTRVRDFVRPLVNPLVREVRFGYMLGGRVVDAVDNAARAEYYRRSRGIPPGQPFTVPPSAMSSALGGVLSVMDVPLGILCDLIQAETPVVQADVEEILPDGRVRLSNQTILQPERLVNTLPAHVFDRLRGRAAKDRWLAGWKTFVAVQIPERGEIRELCRSGHAYAYVADPDLPYDRVTMLDWTNPVSASVEFNRPPADGPQDWALAAGGVVKAAAPAQVLGDPRPEREELEPGGFPVRHVGRMARWDHGVRLHNVVEALS